MKLRERGTTKTSIRTASAKYSLAAAALVLTMLAPMSAMAAPAAGALGPAQYTAVQKLAEDKAALLTETYGIPSVQYALIDHGKIVVSGQSGKNDLNGKRPLTSNTIYGVGSTSKMMLTAAVMKLVDEGKVDLDAPVVNYIPEFKMKDSRYTQITPRMLLNHSSGLLGKPGPNVALYNDNDSYAHDHLLEQLATQNLKADPGAFSVYCNDGFTLAEILVERVSGMSFTTFLHKYITKPLEMNHTRTPRDPMDLKAMAGIYSPTYEGQLPQENYAVIGSGGIFSTAEDLVRFSQIFTAQNKGILSKNSLTAMAQPEYKKGMWPPASDGSLAYGLGWDSVELFPFNQYGIQALVKGGDTMSYHSSLVVLPELNLAAAVISSDGSSLIDQMMASELLLRVLQDKQIIKQLKPEQSFGTPVPAVLPKEVSQYAGLYGNSALLKAEITPAGELSVAASGVPDSAVQKYTYTADGSFVNKEGTEKIKFVVEKNGRTYMWSRSYISVPELGQAATSEYTAEKLDPNPLSAEVADAWEKRDNTRYYSISEKYSSMLYQYGLPVVPVSLDKNTPGYINGHKILSANQVLNEQQIPGMAGRDNMQIDFYTDNGIEYMTVAGSLYVSEQAVTDLYAGAKSSATVSTSGYAKWYSVPKSAQGKLMTVKLPANSSFAVYDQAGICVNHTVVSGKNQVLLPEQGKIVFAGGAGAKFQITLKK